MAIVTPLSGEICMSSVNFNAGAEQTVPRAAFRYLPRRSSDQQKCLLLVFSGTHRVNKKPAAGPPV